MITASGNIAKAFVLISSDILDDFNYFGIIKKNNNGSLYIHNIYGQSNLISVSDDSSYFLVKTEGNWVTTFVFIINGNFDVSSM